MHEVSANNLEMIFQIPPNPVAVLFIAHEGNGSPQTYWEPHVERPTCTGVPDHVALVKYALSKRFAVVAVKSAKSFWQDWPPQASVDAHNVKSLLASWVPQHGLEEAPLVGFGSDSGANFLTMLALEMKFHALVLMVSAGLQKALDRACGETYPPVLFAHMPKDSVTASRVHHHRQLLQSKGVPAAEVLCCDFPINPFYFSNHLPGLGSDASSKLYAIMQSEGAVDLLGRVMSPPRLEDVVSMFLKFDVLPLQRDDDNYIRLLSERVHSLVRVAHGRHALSSRKCPEVFNWLEQQLWGQPAPRTPQNSTTSSSPHSQALQQQRLPFSRFHGS